MGRVSGGFRGRRKPKAHHHALALRLKPRLPLQEVYCPGCGKAFYTIDPQDCEVELFHGSLVVWGAGKKPKARKLRSHSL